jgi:hypothetical protein
MKLWKQYKKLHVSIFCIFFLCVCVCCVFCNLKVERLQINQLAIPILRFWGGRVGDRVSLCTQAGLRLRILLSLPPECQDYRQATPHPAWPYQNLKFLYMKNNKPSETNWRRNCNTCYRGPNSSIYTINNNTCRLVF